MRTSMSVFMAAIIVVVLLGLEYWQYRDAQAYRKTVDAQLILLSERVNGIDERVRIAKNELDEIQQNSLGGLIESANDALIEGWSAMINSVEKELERAKRGIDKKIPSAAPDNSSPSADPAPINGQGSL
ncbi:hypothetical protein [Zhongshania sp. BJYM1]|jgi:hypothetical protein|uniref:hypothetical protein n=1 Tax=Zhongshania aquatica TaxID=2965069 RepID=UPI0022B451E3|nr:hypothetical protein [Marortus sp. BJYM1]